MKGLMQSKQLLISDIIEYAANFHGEREVISQLTEGGKHVYNYRECLKRSKLLALAMQALGVKNGDRVATMAWNNHRHLEAWYGVMGIGAICHTLNPRLFPEDLIYIANHAEDTILMFDLTFIELVKAIRPKLKSVEHFIIMTSRQHMPADYAKEGWLCYEDLLQAQVPNLKGFRWAKLNENDGCGLCYTSGTTGRPKGVLYSHRSNYLQGMIVTMPDAMGFSSSTVCLPIVPMFHANSWGLVFAAPIVGASLVMPGPNLDGESVTKLILDHKIEATAAVPTVIAGLLEYCESKQISLRGVLKTCCVGGAACPPVMIQKLLDDHGVQVRHMWGMTETSPIGSMGGRKHAILHLPEEEQRKYLIKQGRPHILTDMKIVDDDGVDQPYNGKASGKLLVRGPLVVDSYFRHKGDGADKEGWFDTGDVATIDPLGHMQLVDRSKDVIKSGGEWISSIEIENVAQGCAGVQEAAVIGIPHPKWSERPLLVVVRKDPELKPETIKAHLKDKIAKWWIPDEVVFVESIPHTATGKISKLQLRKQLKNRPSPVSKL